MEKIEIKDEVNNIKLPENFFKRIVEFENIHQKNKLIGGFNDIKVIEELAKLYKTAVEFFCSKNKEKENYFFEKLQDLLSNDKVIKLMDDNYKNTDIEINRHA